MAGMPEIGSKISLISKADIRYEGKLFTVDPTECTIALACVRSYGTEDREVENPVPPQPQTYDFILFRGTDIKDIRVVTNQLPNDPAIVQMASVPPNLSTSTYQPHGFSMPPSMGQVGSGMSQYNTYNPMSSMAPGMGRTMPKPQPQSQPSELLSIVSEQVQSSLKDHSVSSSDLMGGGSRSSTPGLLSGVSRKSPTMDQSVQVSAPPVRKDDKLSSRNVQFHFDDGQNQYNREINRSRNSGVIGERPYQQNSYRQQYDNRAPDPNRQQRRNNYIPNEMRQQHQPLMGMGIHGQMHRSQAGQGYGGNNRGNWVNRGGNHLMNNMRQRGGRGRNPQGQMFNRAPGQQMQQQTISQQKKNTLKFEGDYDFDKANNEFEELRTQLAKVKIGEPVVEPVVKVVNGDDIKDDSGNETVVGEGDHDAEEAPVYYDKAKSFFDNISCEAVERSKGRSQRTDWRTERKLNSETFGVASARRGGYRGRGGYYNAGRGLYRGGGRPHYNNRGSNYNNQIQHVNRPKPVNNPLTNNRPQVVTTTK